MANKTSGSNAYIFAVSEKKEVADLINQLKQIPVLGVMPRVDLLKLCFEVLNDQKAGEGLAPKTKAFVMAVAKKLNVFMADVRKEYEEKKHAKIVSREVVLAKYTGKREMACDQAQLGIFKNLATTLRGSVPIATPIEYYVGNRLAEGATQEDPFYEVEERKFAVVYTNTVARKNAAAYQACVDIYQGLSKEKKKNLNLALEESTKYIRSGGTPEGFFNRLIKLYRRDSERGRMLSPGLGVVSLMRLHQINFTKAQGDTLLLKLTSDVLLEMNWSAKNITPERLSVEPQVNNARWGLPWMTLTRTSIEGEDRREQASQMFRKLLAVSKHQTARQLAAYVLKTTPYKHYLNTVAANKVEIMLKDEMGEKSRAYYIYPFWESYEWSKIFNACTGEVAKAFEKCIAYRMSVARLGFHGHLSGSLKPITQEFYHSTVSGDDMIKVSYRKGVLTLACGDLSGYDQSVQREWPTWLIDALKSGANLGMWEEFMLELWKFQMPCPAVTYYGGITMRESTGIHSGGTYTNQADSVPNAAMSKLYNDEMPNARDGLQHHLFVAKQLGFYPKENSVLILDYPVDSWPVGREEVSPVTFLGCQVCISKTEEGVMLYPYRDLNSAINSLINSTEKPESKDPALEFSKHNCEIAVGVAVSSCGHPEAYAVCRELFNKAKAWIEKTSKWEGIVVNETEEIFTEAVAGKIMSFPKLQDIIDLFRKSDGKMEVLDVEEEDEVFNELALESEGGMGVEAVELPSYTSFDKASAYSMFERRSAAIDHPKPVAPSIPATAVPKPAIKVPKPATHLLSDKRWGDMDEEEQETLLQEMMAKKAAKSKSLKVMFEEAKDESMNGLAPASEWAVPAAAAAAAPLVVQAAATVDPAEVPVAAAAGAVLATTASSSKSTVSGSSDVMSNARPPPFKAGSAPVFASAAQMTHLATLASTTVGSKSGSAPPAVTEVKAKGSQAPKFDKGKHQMLAAQRAEKSAVAQKRERKKKNKLQREENEEFEDDIDLLREEAIAEQQEEEEQYAFDYAEMATGSEK